MKDADCVEVFEKTLREYSIVQDREEKKATCKQNNFSWDGECYEMVRTNTTYEGAVEIKQVAEMKNVKQTVTKLNKISLAEEIVEESNLIPTGKMIDVGIRKEGCDWDGVYYCMSRVVRNSVIGVGD